MAAPFETRINDASEGFVLPYVLVVIFILALTTTIAVRSMNSSGQIITGLTDDILAEQRLDSAEADTLFTYLSSSAVDGGIDTSNTKKINDEVLYGVDVKRLSENALWSASGGKRVVQGSTGDVMVSYRDSAGLIHINSDNVNVLTKLLQGFGMKSRDADLAVAKLGDYIDDNSTRRFRGGEAPEYRLKRLDPPTNSKLRTHEEMYQVLGWRNLISPRIYDLLRRYTTLTTSTSYYRRSFLSSEAAKYLGLDNQDGVARNFVRRKVDVLDIARSSFKRTTELGRFVFSTPKGAGHTIIRAVELERSSNALDRPFSRHLVYEEVKNVSNDNSAASVEGKVFPPVFATPDSTDK